MLGCARDVIMDSKFFITRTLQTIFVTSAISAVCLQVVVLTTHNFKFINPSNPNQNYILLQGMWGSIAIVCGSSFLGAYLNSHNND